MGQSDEQRLKRRERESTPEFKAKKAAADKAYRERNKEALSAKAKERYAQNREVVKARVKDYASKNVEKIKAYKEINRERRNQQCKEWHERNKEHEREYRKLYNEVYAEEIREYARLYHYVKPEVGRAWRKNNPDKVKAMCARWARNNKDKVHAKSARRRALLKGARIEYVNRSVVYERDKGICGICGEFVERDVMTLDHIIPLTKGGEHSYANTQVAHYSCNSSKGNRIITVVKKETSL